MITALDIATQAVDEMGGIEPPPSLANPNDNDARQLLALLNSAGRDLARSYTWAALMALETVVLVQGQTDYPLPADYARMIDETQWDLTNRWQLFGPETPQQDRMLRDGLLPQVSLRRGFRQRGTSVISIWPTPTTSGDSLDFEYLSRFWARSSAGAAQDRIMADTDTTVFDPDLMVLELKWRWSLAKGLEATMLKNLRDLALNNLLGADQGGGTLNMGGCDGGVPESQVVAITSPNFALSDGSGNNLIIE